MASDDEFQNRLLQQLATLMESQRSLNSGLSKVVEREADFDAEFAKLSRQVHSLRENLVDIRSDTSGLRSDTSILRSDGANLRLEFLALLTAFRSETAERFDAMNLRMEELENSSEKSAGLIKEIKIEAASHYNEILNAVQSGLINGADLRDLNERIQKVEKRLAP